MDETLVDFYPIHKTAFQKTLKEVFGCKESYNKIEHAGRILPDRIKDMCKICKIPDNTVKKNLTKARKAYAKAFVKAMPSSTKNKVLPGVNKLLNALKGKHKLVLATSSDRGFARKVLKTSGLDKYFKAILCADDADTKSARIKLAIKKTKHKGDVVMIGDSVYDVIAGRANKVKTIAVLTGPTKKARLLKQKPDFIFKNLKNTKKVIEAIEHG